MKSKVDSRKRPTKLTNHYLYFLFKKIRDKTQITKNRNENVGFRTDLTKTDARRNRISEEVYNKESSLIGIKNIPQRKAWPRRHNW